ncbi:MULTISPECIES: hypothetical protein [unclassified Cupriavidus]|uniref:hypothetical protein n=1 Tax=unclassified Cupriavidus TaxID=2640874 RepID=UPI00313F127E
MSKHTIIIEDLPDGDVWISCEPSLEELWALCKRPDDMTSADAYAAVAHMALQAEIARVERVRKKKPN